LKTTNQVNISIDISTTNEGSSLERLEDIINYTNCIGHPNRKAIRNTGLCKKCLDSLNEDICEHPDCNNLFKPNGKKYCSEKCRREMKLAQMKSYNHKKILEEV